MDLSDDDLKMVLSVDPDEDALNKALNQINQQIDSANVAKIKMGLEKQMEGPATALPASFLEQKFGKVGSVIDSLIGKTRFGEIFQGLTGPKGAAAGAGGGTSGIEGALVAGEEGGSAALGAAAGGPITIAYELAKKAAEVGGKLGAVPFKVINAGMGAVATGLREMQGPLGPIGAGLELAGKGLSAIADAVKKVPILGDLLGPMLDQFTMMPGLIKDITTSLTSMAEKAAPGVVKQFNIVLEDAQATIGQAFIPVVQMMTEAVRAFSDMMANVLPNTREVSQGLSGLKESFSDMYAELKRFYVEFGPLIREMIVMDLKYLNVTLGALARMAENAARNLRLLFGPLVDLLGLGGGEARMATTAARPASIGSIEEYQRRLQIQTFERGGGEGGMDVPTNVRSIADVVRNIEIVLTNTLTGFIGGAFSIHMLQEVQNTVRESIDSAESSVVGGPAAGWAARKLFGK